MLVVALSTLGAAVTRDAAFAEGDNEVLSVRVLPNSNEYTLGELVKLTIRITNASSQSITLQGTPSVKNGGIHVLVVSGDEDFRKYEGPGWGVEDVAYRVPVELAPGEFIEAKATVLYNHRLETKHLSPLYANQILKDYLDSEYAFVRRGTYRIKVVVSGVGLSDKVESKPVQIQVAEPVGDDLQVWNILRSDAELGYFLQTGNPKGASNSAKSYKQIKVLESLIGSYPKSRQVNDIRLSLESYRSTLQKIDRLRAGQE
jgi:hypothetical protein